MSYFTIYITGLILCLGIKAIGWITIQFSNHLKTNLKPIHFINDILWPFWAVLAIFALFLLSAQIILMTIKFVCELLIQLLIMIAKLIQRHICDKIPEAFVDLNKIKCPKCNKKFDKTKLSMNPELCPFCWIKFDQPESAN